MGKIIIPGEETDDVWAEEPLPDMTDATKKRATLGSPSDIRLKAEINLSSADLLLELLNVIDEIKYMQDQLQVLQTRVVTVYLSSCDRLPPVTQAYLKSVEGGLDYNLQDLLPEPEEADE